MNPWREYRKMPFKSDHRYTAQEVRDFFDQSEKDTGRKNLAEILDLNEFDEQFLRDLKISLGTDVL
jgi:hypothetical protein